MLRPPHALLAALAATTIVVTSALGWAGWRLLDQQRAIDEQRARAQLEISADAIAAGVRGKLAEAGERLSGWLTNPASSPPAIDGTVVLTMSPDHVLVTPPDGLPFVPVAGEGPAPADVFSPFEAIEFAANQPGIAAERYRVLTRHRDARVRAGAWLRLGRVLRKSGDFAGALTAYQRLTALEAVRTDDLPAELSGLDGQRSVYLATGDRERERRVAAQLLRGLDSGRWLLTRGAAEFYRERGDVSPSSRPDSWQLAEALSDVWRDGDGRHLPARGQRVFTTNGRGVLVLWRSSGSRSALLVAFAQRFFASPISGGIAWHVTDPEGHLIAGDVSAPARPVARLIGNSEYPWTLHVWPASDPPASGNSQTILLTMMAAMLVFVWGASYVMGRAIRREAAVARLQSDFVAAVSHEFRSPLTTVRQMAEMLEMDRIPTEARRHDYYRILGREAARLQRLVETLLNFGRMEAGAERYQFVDIDPAALVRDVVHDIEMQARDAGTHIEVSGTDTRMRVRADGSALAVALRNLIDNAIKYSPSQPTVWVQLKKEHDRAAICVVDRGVGIPRDEQRAIFRKFVRGRGAIDANVKGTGVGLSMVQQIVLAHGGELRLDSESGRGSTFTMLLPARDGAETRL